MGGIKKIGKNSPQIGYINNIVELKHEPFSGSVGLITNNKKKHQPSKISINICPFYNGCVPADKVELIKLEKSEHLC